MVFNKMSYYIYYIRRKFNLNNLFLIIYKSIYLRFCNISKLYIMFKEENWNENPILQTYLIQILERKEAKKQQRKMVNIRFVNRLEEDLDSFTVGKYYYKKNVILLNKNVNSLILLKTYFHEQKHVLQYNLATSNHAQSIEKCQAMIEFDESYDSENGRRYLLQKVELDANFYAIERMLKLESIFKDDPNWFNLLAFNDRYISYILELEKSNTKTMKEIAYNNIVKAYDIELLTNNEFKKLIKTVKNISINIYSSYNHIINLNAKLLKRNHKN